MEIPDRLSAALADRYAIEREIGAGGMAIVYLARDLKHRRHVALKVLREELSAVIGARALPGRNRGNSKPAASTHPAALRLG
jgi:serine/threonine protein kinase